MANRTIKVGIRTDMQNKAGEEDRNRTGNGWSNVELSVDDFISHVRQGFPFTHQFTGGRRRKENFLCTNVLIADIDQGMRLEDALEDDFIKSHATVIYTTPSHTPDNHRFRIVFCLERTLFDGDGYEALYTSLLKKIPTDRNAKSSAQFFFGNTAADIHFLGKSLDDKTINTMISHGMEERHRLTAPVHISSLTTDMPVYVKGEGIRALGSLAAKTSIRCPFGTHQDKNPSAFVKINKDGVRGVECRSCGNSGWSEPPQARDLGFGYFDRVVKQYSGQSNSHFEYLGITKYDHELETSMEKSNFHVFNSAKIDSLPVLPGVNLVKSPKGTGKTHALAKLVSALKDPAFKKKHGLKPNERIILVGHRQTLIRESAAKLGLECYLDTGGFDTKLTFENVGGSLKSSGTQKPLYYAICLDSLHSRVKVGQEKYGVLIIDESEQVFSHFFSEHMKHPTRNFDVLSDLMKQCRFTYCLDADLDTITLTGVMSCLGWSDDEEIRRQRRGEKREIKKLYCHLNTYQPPQRELKLYSSENHLLDDLRNDIRAGKRCFVVSNKKKFIDGNVESFSKVYSDKKFKKVVSNSGNDDDTRAFLKNIREDILNYDAVWASPSIGTGIDITFTNEEMRIDCVYGFFYTGITSHFDIDQQLGRVRHPGEVKVFVMPAKSRFSVDRKRVLQELLNSNMIKGLQYYLDHDGSHYSPGEHPFLELLTEVLVVRRRSMNQLRNNFVSLKEGNGWKVTAVETDVIARDKGSIVNKAGRAEQTRAWFKWVLDAEEIGFQKSYRLQEKKDRNDPLMDSEKASLERYWIKKFYQQDVTEDLVKFDEQGKTREKIVLLETLLDPTLHYRSFDQWQANKDLLSSYDPKKYDAKRVAKAVFLREALSIAGIFDLETFSLKLKDVYGTATLGKFVEFMQNHDERLQRLFEKKVNEDIAARPIVQVRALLRHVGLQQEAVFKNRGGQVGVATYRIEPNSYQKLLDIMAQRAQSKAKDEERPQETFTAQSGAI